MALERPTFQQIRDRILADLDAELDGGPYSAGTVEYALANALAGVFMLLYAAIEIVARNMVPDRADAPITLRWAAFFGIEPRPATPNRGKVRFVASSGAAIPAATALRLSNGREYTVDATTSESGGFCIVDVAAKAAGAAGRVPPGTTITLAVPQANVASTGVVLAPGLTNGSDTEAVRSVLARLLLRLRTPPRGGGPGDYVAWALEVPGVTRAWEYTPYTNPAVAPGTVRLLFVTDGQLDPIPSLEKQGDVQKHIDARRPVTVDFLAGAPFALPVNVSAVLDIDAGVDRVTVEASARANVEALIRREAAPGKTIPRSRIAEAISAAAGEYAHTLLTPATDIVVTSAQLLVPGNFTWG